MGSSSGGGRTSTQVTFWRLFADILGGVGASAAEILRAESVARTMDSGIFTRRVMQTCRARVQKHGEGDGQGDI